MPSSLGSQDSHLSGSDLVPSLSKTDSSRSSQSTPSTSAEWTFEDAAYSDRKPSIQTANLGDGYVGAESDTSGIVRPEPLRAFRSDLAVADRIAAGDVERHSMAAVGRSAPGIPEPASRLRTEHPSQHQQHLHHPQSYPLRHQRVEQPNSDMEGHHQAANYASLAAIAGTLPPSGLPTHGVPVADEAEEGWSSLNDPAYAGAVRLLTENLLSAESAPRLSTSSMDSTVTSELHTPDNYHQPWNMIEAGFKAENAKGGQSLPIDASVDGGLQIGGLDRPIKAGGDASLSPAGAERSNTLKRPTQLSRLSSNATNVTLKPSPPASSSSSSPAANMSTTSADAAQVPDVARMCVSQDAASRRSGADAAPVGRRSPAADAMTLGEHEARMHAGTSSRTVLASPDSWRSLLPEHDPFFVPESSFSPQSEHRFSFSSSQAPHAPNSPRHIADEAGSFRGPSLDSSGEHTFASSFNGARASFSSAVSHQSGSSSLSGLTADTDSWRSFLPDSDRFSLRNAPSPRLSASGALLSPQPSAVAPADGGQLEPPIILDASGHRAAFLALRGIAGQELAQQVKDSSSRRHASFSSYEPPNAAGASRPAMASTRRPTVVESHNGKREGASTTHARPNIIATKRVSSPLSHSEGHTHKLAWTSSSASVDFDDLEDRESWPTSRGRCKQGAASRNDGPVRKSPVSVEPTSPSSVALDGPRVGPDGAGGQVDETSSSVLQATPDGLVATTTTKTTRTTTVTKLIAPTVDVEGAQGPSDDAKSNKSSMEPPESRKADAVPDTTMVDSRRSTSCSISAPLSPPSLPFLDSRPAPPETELMVETGPTQYTLITHLPGFSIDCITLATKQHKNHRTLHLVADKFDDEDGGHFERRVTFPEGECDLVGVRAEFDGTTLRIFVPRKDARGRGFSSASSATF
ncbi:uncharacterized protein PFL1_04188 [Pseudozyma flocculosa PF-1]|uniref:SHSP domain-containing protein n=2 Tax=Pseudozyma flocculosa TaxID=84751 RepID=A0A5C3EUW3_9BASI|nr:uncharacterized protein PFL1_04188 [Pseudozyma flocculosa PF-1]EPQ28361.1 hypothetical protein PFL1_04188 [Pseudozyma flocculosa PF-1]SPO35515.1 uncharacterized protein PSFLO_00986 [Pseudozyma flocculosa]